MFEAQNRRSQGAHHLDNRRLTDLLRASMNANLFAYVVNRDLHQSVPLVSVENSQAADEYSSGDVHTDDEAARIDELLLQEANRHGGPDQYIANHPQVFRFAIFLQYIQRRSTRMDFSSYGELQSLLAQLRSMAPTFAQEPLRDFEEAARERFRLMSNRDRHSAQNLAAQGTSGIHFVGLNHVRQTMLHLRHLCLTEQQGPSPVTAPRTGSESRF